MVKRKASKNSGSGKKRPSKSGTDVNRRSPFAGAALKKIKETLLAHKERIGGDFMSLRKTHLHSSQREATGDLSGYTLHMADQATDTFDREFALTVASSEGDVIYLIEQALNKIDDGTYGLCEVCGKPIRLARLKAVPWAMHCIKCKEDEERGGGEA